MDQSVHLPVTLLREICCSSAAWQQAHASYAVNSDAKSQVVARLMQSR